MDIKKTNEFKSNSKDMVKIKRLWRDYMFRRIAKITNQQVQGKMAINYIRNWDKFTNAKNIACFHSLPQEIDTKPLIKEILKQGKKLYLPKIKEKAMAFYQVENINNLIRGVFGILEPIGNEIKIAPKDIDLIFIPALAVTNQGVRLGRGGGYYDKFMSLYYGESVALILKEQVMNQLPCEEHDYLIKCFITSEGMFKIKL